MILSLESVLSLDESIDPTGVDICRFFDSVDNRNVVSVESNTLPTQPDRESETEVSSRIQKVSKEVLEKVTEGMSTIAEIYYLYGMVRPGTKITRDLMKKYPFINRRYDNECHKSLQSAIERCVLYLQEEGEDQWMAYFKYITSNFYAFWETEENDLVPCPKGDPKHFHKKGAFTKKINILGGVFRGFLSILRIRDAKKFSSFILTINQAKMGLPRPTDDMVEKKQYETATFLTSEPRSLPEDEILSTPLGPKLLCKEAVCEQLRRTTREIFYDKVFTKKNQNKPFTPSTNANYIRGRKDAGAVGTVVLDVIPKVMTGRKEDVDLLKLRTIQMEGSSLIEEASVDEYSPDIFGIMRRESLEAVVYDDEALNAKWVEVMDLILKMARVEVPLVEPVGLAEALKVRVISKGPPLLYTHFKPLQKFLHKTLRKLDVFQLIGTPVTSEIINRMFDTEVDCDVMFLNGDYKASTDNLRGWVSETIADELCKILNGNITEDNDGYFVDYELLIRSLTGHIFVMKDGSHRAQRDGQLMGSITSFPFLCIANAALCRWAMEMSNSCLYRVVNEHNPTMGCSRHYKIPLLINGDDCTMQGKRSNLRTFWSKVTNYGGLTTSVGKTLFSLPHKPIVVINSVTFDLIDGQWIERKYINMGIVMGKTRSSVSGVDKAIVHYHQLGALHRELYDSTPDDCWKEVSSLFISFHKETLKSVPNIPWYCPEYLGGPGLIPDGEVSDKDLRLFSFLVRNINNKRFEISKPRADSAWLFHKGVQEEFEEFGIEETTFSGLFYKDLEVIDVEQKAGELYNLQVVNQLFTKGLREYFQQPCRKKDGRFQNFQKVYDRNMLSHSRAIAEMWDDHTLVVRDWSDIVQRKFFKEYPVAGSELEVFPVEESQTTLNGELNTEGKL
jgi:hypothetical protein